MNPTALELPKRAVKPRENGLTMVIDGGIPLGLFADLISLGAEYIDYLKFGWGTAVVTSVLRDKISVLRGHDIGFYFGGTLFEKFVLQDRFEDYRKFCAAHGASHVEVSKRPADVAGRSRGLGNEAKADPRCRLSLHGRSHICRRGEHSQRAGTALLHGHELDSGRPASTEAGRWSRRSPRCPGRHRSSSCFPGSPLPSTSR